MSADYGYPVGRTLEICSYASRGGVRRRIVIPDPLGPPHTLHDAVSRIRVITPDPLGVLPNGRPVLDNTHPTQTFDGEQMPSAQARAVAEKMAESERYGRIYRRAMSVCVSALMVSWLASALSWLIP